MRSNVVTRTLVTATAIVGIAAGSLAGAGASFAATAPAATPAAIAAVTPAAPAAVVNLGLSTGQAENVQRWLAANWGYTDGIDGQLGPQSWMAFQRNLQAFWGYTCGSGCQIDGDVGTNTVKALQRLLSNGPGGGDWGYTGAIDGMAGSGTQAAFKNFANGICSVDACIA
jgi:peptidoglycan hydrolase-like protein with peptidoglycan-binding domain